MHERERKREDEAESGGDSASFGEGRHETSGGNFPWDKRAIKPDGINASEIRRRNASENPTAETRQKTHARNLSDIRSCAPSEQAGRRRAGGQSSTGRTIHPMSVLAFVERYPPCQYWRS
eukprot:3106132-Rhodomonas_salina.2